MPVTRYSVEQIIAKLREVEKLTGQGMTIPMAAKKVGITDQTFYRWRIRYGALKEDEAKVAAVAQTGEHTTEADRGRAGARHLDAAGSTTGEILSPARRRDAVIYLVKRRKVSEHRGVYATSQAGELTQVWRFHPDGKIPTRGASEPSRL